LPKWAAIQNSGNKEMEKENSFHSRSAMIVIAAGVISHALPASADSLMYNASWGFENSASRSARLNSLDLELRKKGGFYDSFVTNITYDGNTFITYDCTGANARSVGTDSVISSEANTSSPRTGSELVIDAQARGNQLESEGIDGGRLVNDQSITGEIRSDVISNFTNTSGPLNASGGTTTQNSHTSQSNSGTITARAEGGVGCNFFAQDTSAQGHSRP
jgi:hypothetical protein